MSYEKNKDGKFTKTFQIGYHSLNPDFGATYVQLIEIAAETGLLHAEACGAGRALSLETGCGWVLGRWDALFHAFPSWGETVVAKTWPTMFKGFVGERAYELTRADGTSVMTAVNSWVFFDFERRVAAKPGKELIAKYGELFEPCHTPDFTLLTAQEAAALPQVSVAARTVKRGDIDTNGHMNNVRYIGWARDNAPVCAAGAIKRLKVSYKKECMEHETIITETRADGFAATFRMKNTDGVVVAEIDVLL